MQLATIRTPTGTRAVRIDGDTAIELGVEDVGVFLADEGWRERAAAATDGSAHTTSDLDFAPLVPHPEKVICVGLNYLDHIAETGREAPEYPTLFTKYARSLIGANDPIQLPRPPESTMVDWEAELGVVIGRTVRRATSTQAAAAIAGYTVVNDVSVRDHQFRTSQFLQGKAWEGTTPVGPVLAVADVTDVTDAPQFLISCAVDGETMQSSNTSQLRFGPVQLVEYISIFITLAPGDIIATGTPGGVGVAMDPQVFLQRGQTVTTTIEGVGTCTNVCA